MINNFVHDIEAIKVDEVHSYIYTKQDSLKNSLDMAFKFRPEGFQFHKGFKTKGKWGKRLWDGYIHLFNKKTCSLPTGLLPLLKNFAERNQLTFNAESKLKPQKLIKPKELIHYLRSLQLPYKLYDYQFRGIYQAINLQRTCVISSTGSGKSLLIYCIMRFINDHYSEFYKRGKLLITVDGSLYAQLMQDFVEYSINNGFNVHKEIEIIAGQHSKRNNGHITLATWQSLKNKEPHYFKRFYSVISDEVHAYKASSLVYIMKNLINAFYRIGFTGTFNDVLADKLTIQGWFGHPIKISNYTKLIEDKRLSSLEIKAIILKHSPEFISNTAKLEYQEQINKIETCPARNVFTTKLIHKIGSTGKNSLILTTKVGNHAVILYDLFIKHLSNKGFTIFLVTKDTKIEDREKVRSFVENNTKCVIVASYAIYSKGVNIKNLQNAVLTSSTKSTIRILQSIGRTLRLDNKDNTAYLYDLVDDLRKTEKSQNNYSLKHFLKRHQLYLREKFNVKLIEKKLF